METTGLGDVGAVQLGYWEIGNLENKKDGELVVWGLENWGTGELGDWGTGRMGNWGYGRLGDWGTGRLGDW